MSAASFYPNGIGATSGADIATKKWLLSPGTIYYLHSGTGSDSNDGKERTAPFATLSQALGSMSAGDILSVLANHSEVISTAVSSSLDGISILGEGTGAGRPIFTSDVALNASMLSFSGNGVTLDNLVFPECTEENATTGGIVMFPNGGYGAHVVSSCRFECGALTQTAALCTQVSAAIRNCEFASVATSSSVRPKCGLSIEGGSVEMDTVLFDGGSYGFIAAGAQTGACSVISTDVLRTKNIDFINGADAYIDAGTIGYLHVRNKSGSAKVAW